MDLAVLADHKGKIKENENKYLYLTKKIRKLWIMRVISALGSVFKGMERGLEELEIGGRIETIQTTLFRSARILRRVL